MYIAPCLKIKQLFYKNDTNYQISLVMKFLWIPLVIQNMTDLWSYEQQYFFLKRQFFIFILNIVSKIERVSFPILFGRSFSILSGFLKICWFIAFVLMHQRNWFFGWCSFSLGVLNCKFSSMTFLFSALETNFMLVKFTLASINNQLRWEMSLNFPYLGFANLTHAFISLLILWFTVVYFVTTIASTKFFYIWTNAYLSRFFVSTSNAE